MKEMKYLAVLVSVMWAFSILFGVMILFRAKANDKIVEPCFDNAGRYYTVGG